MTQTRMHEYRHLTRHLLRNYRQATPEQVTAGLEWYDGAFTECEKLAWRYGVDTVARMAVATAHLSPRITWAANLRLAEALAAGKSRPLGVLGRSWDNAVRAMEAEDPWSTFGSAAYKTRSFARAIYGDRDAVVVDIWTCRAAGASDFAPKTAGGYTVVADAYRRGARRAGISPRDLQAVCWVYARGNGL